jgi:hypothetical protein
LLPIQSIPLREAMSATKIWPMQRDFALSPEISLTSVEEPRQSDGMKPFVNPLLAS